MSSRFAHFASSARRARRALPGARRIAIVRQPAL